jgi:hypothetical protein
MEFQSIQAYMVLILFISHSKVLGCDRLPPLKEISSLRFGEARKKDGFGILGGLPPLKKLLWVV